MFAAVLGAAVFDLTWLIVGVALPYMQGTFSSTPDQIAWVMTAFIVGGMMMNAVTGWASTRFGRKQLFVLSISGNAVTTLMCGLSDSLAAEVLWRFLQGVTTVPLIALGQGIVLDVFPDDRRAFAIGMFGACTVGVAVFAPLLGGYLVEHYTWRWVFFVNVPMAGLATVCALVFIPRDEPNTGRAFEWWGFLALMALVAALNLSLSRGQRLDWFDSTEIRIEFAIAALALVMVTVRTIYIQNSFLEAAVHGPKLSAVHQCDVDVRCARLPAADHDAVDAAAGLWVSGSLSRRADAGTRHRAHHLDAGGGLYGTGRPASHPRFGLLLCGGIQSLHVYLEHRYQSRGPCFGPTWRWE